MAGAKGPGGWLRRRAATAAPPPAGTERAPQRGQVAPPLAGVSPVGDPVATGAPDGVVLLLTSSCLACRSVWAALGAGAHRSLPGQPRVVVVTPDPTLEDPRRVAALAPPGLTVVMSTDVWQAYRPGPAPWVALVRDGRITEEGAAAGWADVAAMVAG